MSKIIHVLRERIDVEIHDTNEMYVKIFLVVSKYFNKVWPGIVCRLPKRRE